MKTLVLIALFYAQDLVPEYLRAPHPIDPDKVAVGTWACATSLYVSEEGRAWSPRSAFRSASRYANGQAMECSDYAIRKWPSGWEVVIKRAVETQEPPPDAVLYQFITIPPQETEVFYIRGGVLVREPTQ